MGRIGYAGAMNDAPEESNYWSHGKLLAIDSLGIRDRLMPASKVREWILKNVKPDGLMYTQVADFWLRIKKKDGLDRRQEQVPVNPFVYRGKNNAVQGRRDQIEVWHRAWIERIGVEARVAQVKGKHDPVSQSLMKEYEQQHPWLVMNTRKPIRGYTKFVVGWAEGITLGLMDRAYPNPDDLDLEYLTIADALRQPWFDREEQGMWVKILRRMHQLALEEQQQIFAQEYAELARLALQNGGAHAQSPETDL